MNKYLKSAAIVLSAVALPTMVFGQATELDADVEAMVGFADTFFTAIKAFVVGVIGFGIAISIVKWVRRK